MIGKGVLLRLCQARDRLRTVHDRPLRVGSVAREVGMSRYHFIRLFRAVFGETPYQCQLRARIDRAKHLLLMEDDPVTEVCWKVGFSSLGSFSDLFSRRVGQSPSAYRRRVRPLVRVPGEVPRVLRPGCLSLMAGPPE